MGNYSVTHLLLFGFCGAWLRSQTSSKHDITPSLVPSVFQSLRLIYAILPRNIWKSPSDYLVPVFRMVYLLDISFLLIIAKEESCAVSSDIPLTLCTVKFRYGILLYYLGDPKVLNHYVRLTF